jgi:hypothetical protein
MITNERNILSLIETLELYSNWSYNKLKVRLINCQRVPRYFAEFVSAQKVQKHRDQES